ncbi:MAG: helix-hairpin-helix domain-containing protein [Mariprofundaceae bacterium]|nr:helix-hairpin-helix domain-containing protein [Mariprofundaceae bacterium]
MNFKMSLMAIMAAFLMLTGSAYAGDKIDLNTATAEQLQQLKGIGVKTAAAIIAHREAHGGFKSVDDLVDVKGIGKKKLAKIEDDLTVSDSDEEKDDGDDSKKKSDKPDD